MLTVHLTVTCDALRLVKKFLYGRVYFSPTLRKKVYLNGTNHSNVNLVISDEMAKSTKDEDVLRMKQIINFIMNNEVMVLRTAEQYFIFL